MALQEVSFPRGREPTQSPATKSSGPNKQADKGPAAKRKREENKGRGKKGGAAPAVSAEPEFLFGIPKKKAKKDAAGGSGSQQAEGGKNDAAFKGRDEVSPPGRCTPLLFILASPEACVCIQTTARF
jgi:hypothetical protein